MERGKGKTADNTKPKTKRERERKRVCEIEWGGLEQFSTITSRFEIGVNVLRTFLIIYPVHGHRFSKSPVVYFIAQEEP